MKKPKIKELDILRTKQITSVSLTKENQKIKEVLDKYMPYGWFSKFVNNCLRKDYGFDKNLMKSIYEQMIIDNQEQIDSLKESIKKHHNKIKQIR